MTLIRESVSLADKNWFGTGGAARYFAEPACAEEFSALLVWAAQHALDVFVLGSGANILISDEGFDGLVIKPALTTLSVQGSALTAGAGVQIQDLIDYALDQHLVGLEVFSGIPGTVGGATFINIHYFEHLLSSYISEALVVHRKTGERHRVERDWFAFGYNTSTLQNGEFYVVSTTFQLQPANALEVSFARGRRYEIIRHRTRRYPATGTCGSFFRNFLPRELAALEQPIPYVAYYLDQLGIKGTLAVGSARVSHQHANMLVNAGGATSSEIAALARTMQERTYERFGIYPQPECQLIGFAASPLHAAASAT